MIGAAIDAITKWVRKGVQPPHSPQIEITSVSPLVVPRDARGNALGGIRLASFAVPVALDQGSNNNKPGVPGLCFLNGTHIPFDQATLDALYPSHHGYVHAITQAAKQNMRDGFLLEEDAEEVVADASTSIYGLGLNCGPLCANIAQFPLNPSTSILRDHTKFYYFHGGGALLKTLDLATWWVARGYTFADQSDFRSQEKSRKSFAEAAEVLRIYIKEVQHLEHRGRAAPESAALLVDYANILLEKLAELGGP